MGTENRYCIVGAGPAGLAMAAAFKRAQIPFDHFERHSAVGGIGDIERADSPMYESAHLISSRTMSAFLDFPMPHDYPDYPSHRQVLSYLRSYAEHHRLIDGITFGTTVERVVPEMGHAQVTIGGQVHTYRGIVCASGSNWEPILPQIPGAFAGELRHAMTYRDPSELRGKRVVIVGLGNSGADIACDAARSATSAKVSVRRGYHFVPKHLFGMPADVFAHAGPHLPLWLERPLFALMLKILVGDTSKLGMPKPGHALLDSHPLCNDQLIHHLRHGDVSIHADVSRFQGNSVHFSDGTQTKADLVLFATGYSRRIPYLDKEYLDGTWGGGQFLTCFSRKYDSLFTLGFAEINGALYPHLSRHSSLIAEAIRLRQVDPAAFTRFFEWTKTTKFDLTGGRAIIDSPRHAHYCDDHALTVATLRTGKRLGFARRALAGPLPALPAPRA